MVQTLQARNVTLRDLIEQFGVERVQDDRFFTEWCESLLELTDEEKHFLDKVKAGFLNLVEYPPLLDKAVQISVLSPLLLLLLRNAHQWLKFRFPESSKGGRWEASLRPI